MTARALPAPFYHANTHGPGQYDEMLQLTQGNMLPLSQRLEAALRGGITGTITRASGRIYCTFFTAPKECPAYSRIGFATNSGSSVPTLARCGLYSVDGSGNLTLVARTANDTTIVTAGNGIFSRAMDTTGGFPASYQPVAGQRYAWAMIDVSGTPGSSVAKSYGSSGTSSNAPRTESILSGQSDLISTIPVGSLSQSGAANWGSLDA